MYRGKKISLVIPAHNEERLIGPTLETVPDLIDAVFVVDDCSSDQTTSIVEEKGRGTTAFDFSSTSTTRGSDSLSLPDTLESSKQEHDVTVVVGGDNQMPMEQIGDLLDPIIDGRADYTKGNRFMMPEVGLEDMPWTRFVPNALISIMTKVASGYYKVYDVVDGFTAITKRAIELINWNKAWKGYGYPMDFLVRLNAYGLKVSDVPRRAIYLAGERQSQIKGGRYALQVAPMLVRGFFWRLFSKYLIRDFHPLLFFYLFGMLLLPLGVGFGVYLVYLQMTGVGVSGPRSVVCALMIIMGIQFLLFAMLYDMEESQ